MMIAKDRLFLTNGGRVTSNSRHGITLLCSAGSKIPERYVPAVESFYSKGQAPPPEPGQDETADEPADQIESRRKRIPHKLRRRSAGA